MLDISLQEIITAHTDALAAHAEEFLPLIRLLLLLGKGPVSREEIEAFVQSAHLVVDIDGTIHLAPGPHQIQLDGEEPFTMAGCALDTLVFLLLIGRTARVISTCPVTGTRVSLTVTPQGILDLNPQAVVSLRLPDETTSACNTRETICAYGHFFVDRESASAWPGLHPEAVLLSVEDAAHLAREIANASRRHAEKAAV